MAKVKKKLIIGSRGSELALWQANHVKGLIEKNNKSVSVEIKIIKTKGDKILDVALSKIGDKGLFTKELEIALLNGEIHLAVHSLKDLQTRLPDGLVLTAVSKRHSVEDVLIARKKGVGLKHLKEGAKVGTGSLRRRSQILHLRPDLQIQELRGNVPSRIERFLKSDWDAIILARAGVERLKLGKYISSVIPSEKVLPAVGQGALGIEIRDGDSETAEIVSVLHDEATFAAVTSERAFLTRLGGGCQVPIAAYGRAGSAGLYFDGLVGSIDGKVIYRTKIRGRKADAEAIGNNAAELLLSEGAGVILEDIYREA